MIKAIISFPITLIQHLLTVLNRLISAFRAKCNKQISSSYLSINGLLNSVLVAITITLIAFFLQPFEIALYGSSNKNLLIILLGIGALSGMLITEFILPKLFSGYFDKSKWKVIQEISIIVMRLFFTGLVVMIMGNQTGIARFNLPAELLILTGIGSFLGVIYTFLKEYFLHKTNLMKSLEFNEFIKNMPLKGQTQGLYPVMVFTGSNDKISIVPNQLINVQIGKYRSEFNFQNIFGTVKKELDIPKSDVIKEISRHSQFKKTSSDFYVNINALLKVSSDASGFKIKISKLDEEKIVKTSFFKDL